MITLYSGTPGSGKSLHIAQRIYYSLRRGRPVICNFDINLEKVRKKKSKDLPFVYMDNLKMSPENLVKVSNFWFEGRRIKEDEILIVIDECQIIFNSREWHKQGRSDWLSFFTQHRKYGFEIVLIAQFDGMIDRQIRSLIEYEFIHRKVSNFGIVGKVMSAWALGKLFCAVKMWYPLNERIGSEFFIASKKYYSIYDSYGFFEDPEKKIKSIQELST